MLRKQNYPVSIESCNPVSVEAKEKTDKAAELEVGAWQLVWW